MGIIDGVVDGFKDIFSDAPEWKGHRFEKYVKSLFNPNYFTIVEKMHSFRANQEHYVESSMIFNFIFRNNPTREEFAVEVKNPSHLNKDKMLSVCRPEQLKRYKDFANKKAIPYFIVIDLGGEDNEPKSMFSIPLEEINYPNLYPNVFKNFERNPKSMFFWKNGILK